MKIFSVLVLLFTAAFAASAQPIVPIAESQAGPVKLMVLPPFPFPFFFGAPNGPMIAVWDTSPETTGYIVTVDYVCRRDGVESPCQRIVILPRIVPCSILFLVDNVVRVTKVEAKAFKETGSVIIDLEKLQP